MANLTENTQNPVWSAGIYQIETSDPVLGGANGIANRQAKELAARTQWLKTELARAVALIGTNQQTATQQFALKTTSLTAGAGLSGGGVLRDNMTLSLGTPSKITATSQNSAVSNTHTHEIDKASTSVAGIVRLNNTLTSTSQTEALTAAQGKVLAEQAMAAASNANNRVAKTGDTMTGHLKIQAGEWSGVHLFNDVNRETRIETVPGVERNVLLKFADRVGDGGFTSYFFPKATEDQIIAYQSWVNANFVKSSGNQTIRGLVTVQYSNDWVGFYAQQPAENKHGFFELGVNNTLRGGMHVYGEGDGKYGVRLLVTPQGATNQDRRVVGLNAIEIAFRLPESE